MRSKELADIYPLEQRAFNNAPSPQLRNVAQVKAFKCLERTQPIVTFLCTTTKKTMKLTGVQHERALNIENNKDLMSYLHPIVQRNLKTNMIESRQKPSKETFQNLQEGVFPLVAREDLIAGEKLSL